MSTNPQTAGYQATITYPSNTELVITREFQAPRQLVWEAATRPEHVRRWYGAGQGSFTVCDIDLRVGGRWHYVIEADGVEHSWSGEYREIEEPSRLVTTEGYDPIPGASYLSTWTLEERDGVTTMRTHLQYDSTQARDGHVGSGMEPGMNASLDALEALLRELQSA